MNCTINIGISVIITKNTENSVNSVMHYTSAVPCTAVQHPALRAVGAAVTPGYRCNLYTGDPRHLVTGITLTLVTGVNLYPGTLCTLYTGAPCSYAAVHPAATLQRCVHRVEGAACDPEVI